MKKIFQLLSLLCAALCLGLLLFSRSGLPCASSPAVTPAPAAQSAAVPPTATPEPTPTPTPTPEPTPEPFVLSFIGDCTLQSNELHQGDYAAKMNGDFGYPFKNTVQYFENDEYTLANLECSFSDSYLSSSQLYHFYAPTEYANILLEGGVDFVNTANNHTMDFGEAGRRNTVAALQQYNIPYGEEGQSQLVTTPSGIVLGIYTDYNNYFPDKDKCVAAIEDMKAQGAEYIICMFHWGKDEIVYHPKDVQVELAHACIDAGADLIYGSHSHCLQPIEKYNDGIILYSMGNWSFGGSTNPRDPDTAIVQVTIQRNLDGTIENAGFECIPCSISSRPVNEDYWSSNYNDYCPTPYVEGTEAYERALSKLMGTYDGPDQVVDYSDWYASISKG